MKKRRYSNFQIAVIIFAVFMLFGLRFLTPPAGMTQSGLQVAGILIGGLAMWLFVSVDWSSLMVLFALMLVPGLTPAGVIAGSMGNNTAFYLMLCFMLSASLQKTGVAHRLAVWFMTSKLSRKGPWYTVGMIFASIFILSSGLSSTATLMVFLPILTEIFETLGYRKEDGAKFPGIMLTSLVVVAQLAQSSTPISHAMTLIGMSSYTSYTGDQIGFAQYVGTCIPIALLALVLWFVLCRFVFKADVSRLTQLDFDGIQARLEPLSKREIVAAAIYIVCITFWILPGIASYIFPESVASVLSGINQVYPPIIGILVMHFLKIDGEPVIDYKDSLKAVPWSTYIFMGTILYLSSTLSNGDIGLTAWLSEAMLPVFQNISPFVFILLMVAIPAVLTNFISNSVTIAITFAVAMPMLSSIYSGQINPQLIAILITVAANFSFATPTATPPVAVALDTGWINTKSLFVWGMSIAIVCMILAIIVGVPLGSALVAG